MERGAQVVTAEGDRRGGRAAGRRTRPADAPPPAPQGAVECVGVRRHYGVARCGQRIGRAARAAVAVPRGSFRGRSVRVPYDQHACPGLRSRASCRHDAPARVGSASRDGATAVRCRPTASVWPRLQVARGRAPPPESCMVDGAVNPGRSRDAALPPSTRHPPAGRHANDERSSVVATSPRAPTRGFVSHHPRHEPRRKLVINA